jgi:hypothetical protein
MQDNTTKPFKFVLRSAFCVLTCALLMTSGCEVLGVAAHTLVGEAPVPAQYVPPVKPTLVLVENYRSPDEMRLDGDQLARQIGDTLKKEAKLEVVDSDKLQEMREDDADAYRHMNITAIGKAVGAKTVIYVDLLESDVSPDPTASAISAVATVRVKVVDVETGNTLWPADGSRGCEITEKKDYNQYDPQRAVVMHTQMLTTLSSKISKLFYTWKPDGPDDETQGG